MGWSLSVVSTVVFASSVLALAVGFYAFRKRPDPMAWPLTVLMVGIAAWAIPHGISMGYTDVDRVVFWNQAQFVGVGIAPVAYLVVALKYAGYERYLSRWLYPLLGTIPATALVAVWSYPRSRLYWRSAEVETAAGVSVLAPEFGPLHWVNLGYLYLVTLLALSLLASVVVRSGPVHKKQSTLLFVAGLVPLAANVAFTLGAGPLPPVDFTTTALAVSGMAFAVTLFRYDLLDLSPAAYRNVSEVFGDGVLVFDDEHRLVEANDHARSILGKSLSVGTAAEELFDAPLADVDRTVLRTTDGTEQFYNLRHEPFSDYRGRVVGHVVVMREVTDLKEHEQRLNVTNRILRHNLRNDLNIIAGHVAMLEEQYPDEKRLVTVQRATERLMDLAEKARAIRASLRGNGEVAAVDAVAPAEAVVERYSEQYPEATVHLDAPETLHVRATGPAALETVLENVVENALVHTDRDEPTVSVEVAVDDGGEDDGEGDSPVAVVRVRDNGPGIPGAELRVLEAGRETQLEHGSGLGLWAVSWLVSRMGGSVEFGENEPRGTVVCIRLPRADLRETSATRTAQTAGKRD